MSAVETAARAHCRISCDEMGQTVFCEQYGCKFWNAERRLAETRAVIASLRVPTPEMVYACSRAIKAHVDGMDPVERATRYPGGRRGILVPAKVKAVIRWQAMIDAALSEPRIEAAAGSAPGEGGE